MQNGVTTSIKPQQITYIVPGVENFDHAEISDFIQKAQSNLVSSSWSKNLSDTYMLFPSIFIRNIVSLWTQDSTLLEFAWVELLENNKSVTVEELAEVYVFKLNAYVSLFL